MHFLSVPTNYEMCLFMSVSYQRKPDGNKERFKDVILDTSQRLIAIHSKRHQNNDDKTDPVL